ncbi:DUF2059 domain-containing protein [uncultured Sphingomonas sp.]|uniref:DUF2059 domain-containing protein n=1 Tax=uncultured Sphingomonas sp. TaxID=158754 RepID=UPI0025F123E3|nr:DUF2059 domain-containing protein [uncultured Sphingomonas sp.]
MSALLALLLVQATPVAAAPAPAAQTATVDPSRKAAAETAVLALVPPGTYMRMMRDQFPKMMDAIMARTMGMTAKDLGAPEGDTGGKTLREMAATEDPHFEERMHIMTTVMSEDMGKIFESIEPEMRVGLSRAFARRFTLDQLNDINAFFATPSGKVFAADYLATFMDPEVMEEMMSAMPKMMQAMPAMMARAEKATAHLPPPPKKDGAKTTTGKAK